MPSQPPPLVKLWVRGAASSSARLVEPLLYKLVDPTAGTLISLPPLEPDETILLTIDHPETLTNSTPRGSAQGAKSAHTTADMDAGTLPSNSLPASSGRSSLGALVQLATGNGTPLSLQLGLEAPVKPHVQPADTASGADLWLGAVAEDHWDVVPPEWQATNEEEITRLAVDATTLRDVVVHGRGIPSRSQPIPSHRAHQHRNQHAQSTSTPTPTTLLDPHHTILTPAPHPIPSPLSRAHLHTNIHRIYTMANPRTYTTHTCARTHTSHYIASHLTLYLISPHIASHLTFLHRISPRYSWRDGASPAAAHVRG